MSARLRDGAGDKAGRGKAGERRAGRAWKNREKPGKGGIAARSGGQSGGSALGTASAVQGMGNPRMSGERWKSREIIYAPARLGAAGGPAPAGWEGGRGLSPSPLHPPPPAPQPHTASPSPSQLGRHRFNTARAAPGLLFLLFSSGRALPGASAELRAAPGAS